MPHDVFISYSSIDKTAAFAACATFEAAHIRCWIAPRDVAAGAEWAEAIIDAIERARVMVLIFSTHANESRQVKREIELAVSRGLTIMPLRLEKIAPTKSMAYYMAGVHWLDALSPPLEAHFRQMVSWIKPHLGGQTTEPEPPPKSKPQAPPPTGKAGAASGSKPRTSALTPDEAQRLHDAARDMINAGKRAEAAAAFRTLMQRIGEPADDTMRRKLAMSLHSHALNLERLGQNAEAVVVYDEIVGRYRQSPDAVLAERIAMVLVDRGNPLNELGRKKDAIASYDELDALFGSATDPGIVAQLARAGICRGIVLDEARQPKEAIAAYDAVVRRYGSATNARLMELVAIALFNRAVILEGLGQRRDARAGCEEIVRRYGAEADEKLQHQVKLARDYLAKLR